MSNLSQNPANLLPQSPRKAAPQHAIRAATMPKAAAKKEKKKKDPNAPKRPLAPYMFYCKEQREKVKASQPDISFGEIGKVLGQQWSAMSEKDKKVRAVSCFSELPSFTTCQAACRLLGNYCFTAIGHLQLV